MLEEDIDFALEAVGCLGKIVKALATRHQKKGSSAGAGATAFCSLLNADLCHIRIWLENNRTRADPSHFDDVLAVLEAICQVGRQYPRCQSV